MILLVVTREAKGSSGWQPRRKNHEKGSSQFYVENSDNGIPNCTLKYLVWN